MGRPTSAPSGVRALLASALVLGLAAGTPACDLLSKKKDSDSASIEKEKKKKAKAAEEAEEEEADEEAEDPKADPTDEPKDDPPKTAQPADSATPNPANPDAKPADSVGSTPPPPPPASVASASPPPPPTSVLQPITPPPPARPTDVEFADVKTKTKKKVGALDCETKVIRDWVRVGCRSTDKKTLPTMNIVKGNLESFFSDNGETGLYYQFEEGQDLQLEFSLDKDRINYASSWDKGAPKPATMGVFELAKGTATPPTPGTKPKIPPRKWK